MLSDDIYIDSDIMLISINSIQNCKELYGCEWPPHYFYVAFNHLYNDCAGQLNAS